MPEDIKLGTLHRDVLIDNWCESLRQVARVGVPVVCYNFMPVFDWTRTQLAMPMPDGSTALAYDDVALSKVNLARGTGDLPGWSTAYTAEELNMLLAKWKSVGISQLWDNLANFLERVVPVAAELGVKLAIHPDDPPWSVFGLPRIITSANALQKSLSLVDSPANGLTFCTGSMAASADNDVPAMVREFSSRGRIHFMHCRNIKRTAIRQFHEAPHPTRFGDVNMLAVLTALCSANYLGPVRPDHGRMIRGETGQPGYGLHDRALGAMYLQGVVGRVAVAGRAKLLNIFDANLVNDCCDMTPVIEPDTAVAQLRKLRVLPVLVISDSARAVALGDALFNGGLPVVEITLRTPAALDAIKRLSSERPNVLVGAGTVLNTAQAKEAIENGAQFIVSPGLNPAVVEYCQSRSVPIFPGVVTPTEIETAMRLGLRVVKFFPAEPAGGVRYLQAVSAPYGEIEFIPTGGLKRALMATYLATGRVIACGGSWMAPDAWLAAGDFARVERETKDTMMEVSAIPQS